MRLLVNTLSIGSMSGQHVVYGFLRPFISWMLPDHDIVVLHYDSQPPPNDLLESGIGTITVSDQQKHWVRRTAWEATKLSAVVRKTHADLVLTVSGAISANGPVPQVTLCQNPWCFRPPAHRNWKERLKAKLQRIGYRKAFRNAALMIYISNHLKQLYQTANPDLQEQNSAIAYVGLNEDTFMSAKELAGIEREPFSIVSVSAMAHWKGAETIVRAVRLLHDRDIPATLKLIGPWPDTAYEQQIRALIDELQLDDAVSVLGKVSVEDLHRYYATSQTFCLMSSCESYGIPAAEAMCFGTPVISTDCCAISEICQGAGLFGPVSNAEWTANALDRVLTDNKQWQIWSNRAIEQAQQLSWENCAQAFKRIPELVGQSIVQTAKTTTADKYQNTASGIPQTTFGNKTGQS